MKDKSTKKILLKGNLKEGLYEFQSQRSQAPVDEPSLNYGNTTFTGSLNSSNVLNSIKQSWHIRLGHPSDRVLNQVLKDCNVKIESNESYFCEPCQYGKNRALPLSLSTS